jgi:hypothetical protein
LLDVLGFPHAQSELWQLTVRHWLPQLFGLRLWRKPLGGRLQQWRLQ